MNLWELEKLGHAWTAAEAANYRFEFGGYKKTLGKCYHWPKKVTVGKTYAQDNDKELVINTLIHEIAHAVAGPNHGHDKTWKKIFKELLIKYNQPVQYIGAKAKKNVINNHSKYKIFCEDCNANYNYMRKCWWMSHKDVNGYLTKVECKKCKTCKFKIIKIKGN